MLLRLSQIRLGKWFSPFQLIQVTSKTLGRRNIYISFTVDYNNDLFQELKTASYVKNPNQTSADFITKLNCSNRFVTSI